MGRRERKVSVVESKCPAGGCTHECRRQSITVRVRVVVLCIPRAESETAARRHLVEVVVRRWCRVVDIDRDGSRVGIGSVTDLKIKAIDSDVIRVRRVVKRPIAAKVERSV